MNNDNNQGNAISPADGNTNNNNNNDQHVSAAADANSAQQTNPVNDGGDILMGEASVPVDGDSAAPLSETDMELALENAIRKGPDVLGKIYDAGRAESEEVKSALDRSMVSILTKREQALQEKEAALAQTSSELAKLREENEALKKREQEFNANQIAETKKLVNSTLQKMKEDGVDISKYNVDTIVSEGGLALDLLLRYTKTTMGGGSNMSRPQMSHREVKNSSMFQSMLREHINHHDINSHRNRNFAAEEFKNSADYDSFSSSSALGKRNIPRDVRDDHRHSFPQPPKKSTGETMLLLRSFGGVGENDPYTY